MTREYKGRNNYTKKEEKRPDLITDDVKAAEALGLSFGQYIAYRDTGYLPRYIEMKKAEEELCKDANVIESHIGGRRFGSRRTHFLAQKF